MFYFSKVKYCDFCECPQKAWLNKYKPEECFISESSLSRMAAGGEVGELARGYFGEYVNVTVYDGDKPDLTKMIERTKDEIAKNTPVICEASFNLDGLYCAVDILKREDGGWAIYEVKSSTKIKKPRHINDIAYQKYVLEHCGVNVTKTYIMYLNNKYVFDGELDIHSLFTITDLTELAEKQLPEVGSDLAVAEKVISCKTEPGARLGVNCTKADDCGYWGYCTRELPKPNVFELYNFRRKRAMYEKGLVSFEQLEGEPSITGEMQKRQIDFHLHDRGTYIDKEGIVSFLDKLSYPLYFLDFESVQPVIPKYVGTTPYQQIPFQYSLHYVESEDGEVKHKEFLAEAGTDPLRAISESLCRDIPADACVTVYNMTFEFTRFKELAKMFPDLSEHLTSIGNNIVDFLVPFREGWYYKREMGGSLSIKSVLPALFPDDPSLDYHNLEGIQNGGDAMSAFPAMENMSPEQLAETRKNLLKYCELDTYALVKVWQALREAVK